MAAKTLSRSGASDVLVSHHHAICNILSASETTLHSLTGKLYEMRIVDRPTKIAVISKGQYKGADILLDHVDMKVNDKPRLLRTILDAMRELEALKDVVEQMDKWKAKDMNTLQDSSETDFKEVDTLDPVVEAEKLKQQFGELLMSILQSMGQVDLDVLKLQITWYFNSENVITPEIQEIVDELQSLTTPQRILNFLLIRKLIGYLNYELIKAFQNSVKSDETKTKIKEYERKYDAFLCQFSFNAIIEAFKNRADLAPISVIGLPKFTVRLDQSWEGKTVYEWKDVWENRFTWPPSLIIVGIERNCIVLTYAVLPFFIPSVVRDLEDSDIIKQLENAGVSVELSTDLIKFGRQDDGDWINEEEVAGKNEIPSKNGGSNTTQVVCDASNSFDLGGRKYDPQIPDDVHVTSSVVSKAQAQIMPVRQPPPESPVCGYDDYIFISTPPESLKCPVCLLVVREPHQLSCCGAIICQVCIERTQASQQICPCCRSDEFIKILDKRTRGMELYSLKVRCENQDCDWIGELGELHRHLSNKCQYITERCQYECGDYYHRYALPVHEQDECPNRPLEVKIESNQRKVMEKFTTLEFMYQGEVESLKAIMKKQEERHKMEKQEMYQNLEKQKEQYELEKKDLQEKHEKDRMSINRQLLLNRAEIETLQKKTETDKTELVRYVNEQEEKHETTNREFVQQLEKQTNLEKQEIALLQRRTESDKKEIMECIHDQEAKLENHNKKFELDIKEHRGIQEKTCEANKSELLQKLQNQMEEHQRERKALEEKISNVKREFQQYKQESQEKFTLTIQHEIQEQNERFKRELEAHKKEKKELHHKLSEEGKRQDELQQQLKAKEDEYQAQLEVLKKQESDEISKLKHELSEIELALTHSCSQQTENMDRLKKWIFAEKAYPIGQVPEWYYQSTSESIPLLPPCIIAMNNFSQHKTNDDSWFSPPFNTAPYGYKAQLRIDAVGNSSAKGTHISASVYLMKGCNDDKLKWPFEGRINVQLLNSKEDQNHVERIFSHNMTPTYNLDRVSNRERAPGGMQYQRFITQTDLDYNPDRNTQYLRDDTLYFQVSKVTLLTGQNPKTPRWYKPSVKSPHHLPPCLLTMSNFSEYRRINSTWYSPAFHIAGYQLQLVVEPGGLESGKGNYVSVYVRLMKGKHDYMLEWPFKAEMIIDLINWGEDKGHVTKTLRFDGNTPIRYRQRVTQDHAAPYIWGYDKFIQHADLDDKPNNKKRFLQDDTLCFRVLKITLLTDDMTIAHPPCIIAMNNFSQHKTNDDSWFSPPFYTAPNGYKAQLRIDAVGHSSAKGTHISASVYLMKSQNDDKLKWPFKGFINLQLLNSKEDRNHVERIFSHNMAPSFCLDRVSSGDRAAGGMYYQQFIAHSNLHHNIDRSTHYLCDDTLYFKVSKVTMLTGETVDTPSWYNSPISESSQLIAPCLLTMSNFHEYKNISSRWWSPAFYTAKCGYRLQLVVDPDGSDSGKGTHLSAGVFLTKGEDDLSLDWPLKIDVTIKLLNWREDNRHVETIIPFNDSTPFDCRNRITEDTIAPNGMFEHQLISHADLQYNNDKNTEYLHHDSLCFQVSLPAGPTCIVPDWYPPIITKSSYSFPPLIINMMNFSTHKKSNEIWYSPPFYTSTNGYKLQLRVDANGNGKGKGTHVSLFVCLMKGENDQYLQWPFKGDISIQMLNWREDNQHKEMIIPFNDNADIKYRSKVIEGERGEAWGKQEFIRIADLQYDPKKNSAYLQDDTLCIKIPIITLLTGPEVPSWYITPGTESPYLLPPCTLSMHNFSEHKRVSDQWLSKPFYTGPDGYKLNLRVDANGYGSGKGTHVSVYVYLMKGENDDILTWPFKCDIIIRLLNWREDKGHVEKILDFNDSDDIKYRKRVMEGDIATDGLGYPQFISHSDLYYNITNNTEYINNDILCFVVSKVIVYS